MALDEADRHQIRQCLADFRRAWLRKPEPSLVSYLPPDDASTRRDTLAQLVEIDLKFRWRSSRGQLAEFYLDHWPELRQSDEICLAVLRAECLARSAFSDGPSTQELEQRFPTLADQIDLESIRRKADQLRTSESIDRKGRYFLLRQVGKGGMGIVHEAFDRLRRERVALKILPYINHRRLLYFKREFRALTEVAHRNLASMYELHATSDRWFLTMQFVDGVNFRSYLQSNLTHGEPRFDELSIDTKSESFDGSSTNLITGTRITGTRDGSSTSWPFLPVDDFDGLRDLVLQLAEGVTTLHQAGVLHRDLKPSNVMVQTDGLLKILDFGLVTHLESHGTSSTESSSEASSEPFSRTGTDLSVVGTFTYMSPEQALGRALKESSDWYAVGLILFEALTGRRPYNGPRERLLEQKLSEDPPPVQDLNPFAPDDLAELCRALLIRDPNARADGNAVSRLLKGRTSVPIASARPAERGRLSTIPFVGRKESLEQLHRAFSHIQHGEATIVHVSGPSGAGKTRLVHQFLSELEAQRDALVLSGQCYENESVPYKALDALVDALSMFLAEQPAEQLTAWLPPGVGSLAVMFPVLNRIPRIADTGSIGVGPHDAVELRRRAFAAMRELLIRVSKSRPLVFFIDDLQWGDTDSAGVLSELVRAPHPPRLLLIAGYRTQEARSNSCIQALIAASGDLKIDSCDVSLQPLSEQESEQLARQLIGLANSDQSISSRIARESQGTPFLILELAQHVRSGNEFTGVIPSTQVELDEVLWTRVQRLPSNARALLEVIALSGQPLRVRQAMRVADLDLSAHDALTFLRAERFVQGQGPSLDDQIGMYHDRIRESVVAHLSVQQRCQHHERLASIFESDDDVDPERIAEHFLGAGQNTKAGSYFAMAADRAAEALAFERAARLYQCALDHMRLNRDKRRKLKTKLGDALANAGRGMEAARCYQDCVDGAPAKESLELQKRAAFQYCISGYVDEGRAAMDHTLRQIGLRLPTTPTRALASLLLSRFRLRIRGLRFRQRDVSEVAQRVLDRIDLIWSAAAGLSMFDVLQGADFQTRHSLMALNCGEPFRLSRAMSWEGAHLSNIGGSSWPRAQRLLDLGESLADQVDDPYAGGFWELSSGIADFTNGRWRSAHKKLQRAQATLREHCLNVAWEIGTAQAFDLWSLLYMGQIAEMGREATVLTREARERGDLYAETTHRAFAQPIGLLVHGDVDHCIQLAESALRDWTREGFHVQHIVALMCLTYLDLYRGSAESAYMRMEHQWQLAKRSHLLRVQVLRSFLTHLRARCSLAYATQSGRSSQLLREAERDAFRIRRENMPYCQPHFQHILAAVKAHSGDKKQASQLLDQAIQGYTQCDMMLFANVVKWRKGELVGGIEGRELIEAATQWMTKNEIVDCARMADAFAARFV